MPDKQQSILLGTLVAAILSTSYLGFINLICCLGVIIGSMTAVWHYTSNNSLTIPAGQGAGMGAIAGGLGMIIAGILSLGLAAAGINAEGAILDAVIGFLENSAENASGDQLEQIEEQIASLEEQRDAQGSVGDVLMGLFFSALAGSIFGAIGGVLGAVLFKKGPESEKFDDYGPAAA